MKNRLWLIYSLVTTAFWGVWGALIELPEKAGEAPADEATSRLETT
jgi:hypothetical protein